MKSVPGVATPGTILANPELGSIAFVLSPPKLRANTLSGKGVNFSALGFLCFLFLASPTSGICLHSSSDTFLEKPVETSTKLLN